MRAEIQQACPRPEWFLWIVGATGTPMNDVLVIVCAWAELVAAEVPEGQALANYAIELAEEAAYGSTSAAQFLEVAERAEEAAASAPATFRDLAPIGFESLARASAWIARAAEGLIASRRRFEAIRMDHASRAAGYLGAGVNAFVGKEPPVRLLPFAVGSDPVQAELVYVVAAMAEAASQLVQVRAAKRGDADDNLVARDAVLVLQELFAQRAA